MAAARARWGRAHGLVSGLGAASADAIYGSVAALGLTAVTQVLVGQTPWLRAVGGLAMVALGWRTLRRRPAATAARATSGQAEDLAGAWASTFALTLTNPMTILSFAAIMAGLGLGSRPGLGLSAAAWVAGVFVGSALWWLTLSTGGSLLRTRLPGNAPRWIGIASGLVLAIMGALALASLVHDPTIARLLGTVAFGHALTPLA